MGRIVKLDRRVKIEKYSARYDINDLSSKDVQNLRDICYKVAFITDNEMHLCSRFRKLSEYRVFAAEFMEFLDQELPNWIKEARDE